MTDLTRLHAHEMTALLRAGELSSRELASAHLERMHAENRGLNAWLSIDDERALAEADAADARLVAARAEGGGALEREHPLLGVPVALKDLISVRGGQCTAGSRILEGYISPYDAHIVERLHDVGAVMLGKTNMDEFAMGSSNEFSGYGPVSNPWDLGTVPGGSSGWLRGRRGRLPRAPVHRHGYGRVDPPARGPVRDRRAQADVRPRVALRDRGIRVVPRPDRAVRARRA